MIDLRFVFDAVEGLITEEEADLLYKLSSQVQDGGVIVEIGSYRGRSSVVLGLPCLNTNKRVVCVDCWQNEEDFRVWNENIEKFGLSKTVLPVKNWSGLIFPVWDRVMSFYKLSPKIDFIFIDGNHELSDIMKDFSVSYNWIKEKGIIAIHDVGNSYYPAVLSFWEMAKSVLFDCGLVGTVGYGRKASIL